MADVGGRGTVPVLEELLPRGLGYLRTSQTTQPSQWGEGWIVSLTVRFYAALRSVASGALLQGLGFSILPFVNVLPCCLVTCLSMSSSMQTG